MTLLCASRTLLFGVLLWFLYACESASQQGGATPSECLQISDPDVRNLCHTWSRNQGSCQNIDSLPLREFCHAIMVQPEQCALVSSPDFRTLCWAITQESPICAQIQDQQLRFLCHGQKDPTAQCAFITAPDWKNLCWAVTEAP